MFKVALFILMMPLSATAQVLQFFAESLPPYHFTGEDKQPTGALVEVTEAAARQAGFVADIRLLPFARGYQYMLTNPNTFMFSLLRTPPREGKMQWVGKTYKIDAYLVGLKGRDKLKINNLEQAKKRVVGTIRGYHSERFLKDAGFTEAHNLSLSINYQSMWNMLFRKRIDFILTNTVSLDTEIKSLGLDAQAIEKYYEVKDFPGELFMVTHLETSKETVKKLADGLSAIKQNGQYQKIIDKWGL